MITAPIPAIPGALANDEGKIKLPESSVQMPNGGIRAYKTDWTAGTRKKASKRAEHVYYGIVYRGRNYKIHRLVCEAFHGPAPTDKHLVIHLDEDATNNRPNNLKWGTQKENLRMPKFIEYCRSRRGEMSCWAKHRKKKSGDA